MPDPGPPPPPRRRASALHYQPGDPAPRVIAGGSGLVAERIIAAAREAGVPVREDPALAQALAALDLGESIPEAMWKAVAETLAWAYRLDADLARRKTQDTHRRD
ncbi:MAG TPA: EscU/YscU/HrcU family type III secretion system export apparatus switch protein [Solirubrobacteraceae bacterium]|jgi:flagellar biosynthesis protein|nr:EscU/YscU/HrcU family type III secretion system export apparatus switch protein [Solirubrobacteraceae bacterium]